MPPSGHITGMKMKYIPDKKLYSAVMFALKMCPNLQCANDAKIKVAADYYHVDQSSVLEIVRRELWERAADEAKAEPDRWMTIYNPTATCLLNTGFGNDFVLICPRCGEHYACNSNDYFKLDKLFVSRCKCGFADEFQRKCVRKELYQYYTKGDKQHEKNRHE